MAVARLTRTRKVLLWGLLLTLCLAAVNTILSGPGHMQSCVGGICVKIWRGADLDGPPISPLGIWTARHVQTQGSPGNISHDEGPEIREDEPKKTGLIHPVDIGFEPGIPNGHSRNTVNEHLETDKPQHSPDGVTRVLLVTYMRGGSSVLGEAFNHNPDAFYWFEPLDGLYSDLYGTMHGWMPIDILYHKNKTMRVLPQYERKAIVEGLKNIYNCDVNKLPIDVMTNYNLITLVQERSMDYAECVRLGKHKPNGSLALLMKTPKWQQVVKSKAAFWCKRPLYGYCPRWFLNDNLYKCHDEIHSEYPKKVSHKPSYIPQRVMSAYQTCLNMSRKSCSPCFHLLADNCRSASVRVNKVIRLDPSLLEDLILAIPGLRVIVYHRDPRGIVASRMPVKLNSMLAGPDMVKEGQLLCGRMARDISHLIQLKARYPHNIMTLRYEDVTADAMNALRDIYSFTGVQLTKEIKNKFAQHFSASRDTGFYGTSRKNATRTAAKWRTNMSASTRLAIASVCSDVLQALRYEP